MVLSAASDTAPVCRAVFDARHLSTAVLMRMKSDRKTDERTDRQTDGQPAGRAGWLFAGVLKVDTVEPLEWCPQHALGSYTGSLEIGLEVIHTFRTEPTEAVRGKRRAYVIIASRYTLWKGGKRVVVVFRRETLVSQEFQRNDTKLDS